MADTAPAKKLRVVRTILLEGPEDWVLQTLAKSWLGRDEAPFLGLCNRTYELERTFFLPGNRVPLPTQEQEALHARVEQLRMKGETKQ